MSKGSVWVAVVMLGFAGVSSAQMPGMQATAEHKSLDYFAGTWTMEGELKPSPFGPGGRMTGSETCERLGAFHLVCRSKGSGPMGAMDGVAIMSYDTVAKAYTYYAVNSMMPAAEFARGVRDGKNWRWSSEANVGGEKIQSSFSITDRGPSEYGMKWETTTASGGKTTIMEATAKRQ